MTHQSEEEVVHFLKELLNPEGFGWAVTQEVRNSAKRILTMIESDNDEQNSAVRQTLCSF